MNDVITYKRVMDLLISRHEIVEYYEPEHDGYRYICSIKTQLSVTKEGRAFFINLMEYVNRPNKNVIVKVRGSLRAPIDKRLAELAFNVKQFAIKNEIEDFNKITDSELTLFKLLVL